MSISHYTAKYRVSGEKDKEAMMQGAFMRIYLGIGVVCLFAGMLIVANVGTIFAASFTASEIAVLRSLLIVIVINVSVSFPLSIYTAVITGYERFVFLRGMNLIRTVMVPVCVMIVLSVAGGAFAAVLTSAVVSFLCNVINVYYCRDSLGTKIKYRGMDSGMLKEFLSYSAFVFIGTIADKLFWGIDQLLLGMISGGSSKEISIYENASVFINAVLGLSSVIVVLYMPRFTAMVKEGISDKEVSDKFISLSRIQFYISAFFYFGFMLVGREFIIFWVGPEREQAYYIALIVITGIVLVSAEDLGTAVVYAKGAVKFRSCLYLIVAVLNVILTALFILNFGSMGAAAATFITYFFGIFIIMMIYYQRVLKLDMKKLWKKQIPVIVFGGTAVILVKLLLGIVMPGRDDLWFVLIAAALFTVVYLLCLWAYVGKGTRGLIISKVKGIFGKKPQES